ncbi:MAG: hypothetical protein EZS28_055386, partial [Streblomastix strix]
MAASVSILVFNAVIQILAFMEK